MGFRILADAVVVLHLAFVAFVVGGGLLVARWARLAWLHLPAVAWAVAIELGGFVCPLTPLENWLRTRARLPAYTSGFVEQYLLPVLYPPSLTREVQWLLAALILGVNAAIYTRVLARRVRR